MIYVLPLEIPITYVNKQSIAGYCSDLGCKVLGTVRNGIVLSITSDSISGYRITVKNASGVTPAYRKVKLIVKPNNNSENLCKGLKLFKPSKKGKLNIQFPKIKNAEKYRLIYKCQASKDEPATVTLKNLKKHKKSYRYTTKVKYPKKKYYVQIQYLLKNDTKWTKLAKSKTKKF